MFPHKVKSRARDKAGKSVGGGQQRLVEFARCLDAAEPAFDYVDEPSMGLDPPHIQTGDRDHQKRCNAVAERSYWLSKMLVRV